MPATFSGFYFVDSWKSVTFAVCSKDMYVPRTQVSDLDGTAEVLPSQSPIKGGRLNLIGKKISYSYLFKTN